MRLGIYFDGFSPASEVLEISREAEAAGADSLWFAQHMGYREALIMAGAVAGCTKKIRLVPTAITPYLWRSLPTAMSLATLDELAPGRINVAVSVGNVLNLGESGVEPALNPWNPFLCFAAIVPPSGANFPEPPSISTANWKSCAAAIWNSEKT